MSEQDKQFVDAVRRWRSADERDACIASLEAENKRLANALRSLLRYVERCRESGWLVCDDIGPEEWARYELEQVFSLPLEQPSGHEAEGMRSEK